MEGSSYEFAQTVAGLPATELEDIRPSGRPEPTKHDVLDLQAFRSLTAAMILEGWEPEDLVTVVQRTAGAVRDS